MTSARQPLSISQVKHYRELETRFWAKVACGEPDECWPWTGSTCPARGYGHIGLTLVSGKRCVKGAHRVAWILEFGHIPVGLDVLHRCDNPPCINPRHLFLGTHGDNMRDAVAKGRLPGKGRARLPQPPKWHRDGLRHEENGSDWDVLWRDRKTLWQEQLGHKPNLPGSTPDRGTVCLHS